MNKESKILINFLKEYAERLSNASCNDWEFPKDWNKQERRAFLDKVFDYHKMPKEDRNYGVYQFDIMIFDYLVSELKKILP